MEIIFDGVSYQNTDQTVKELERTITSKKKKFSRNMNMVNKEFIDTDDVEINTREFGRLKNS